MDSPQQPQAPDPYATADAQGKYNSIAAQQTATLNRPDQYTPLGSQTWTQDPNSADRWTSRINLDPRAQAVLDSQLDTSRGLTGATQGALDRVNSTLGTSVNYDGLPGVPTAAGSRNWASGNFTDPTADLQAQQGVTGSARDAQGRALTNLNNTLGQDFNYSGAPGMPTGDEAMRRRVEDSMYQRATSRLDPQFAQSENKMRTDLMNRGITEGSEAWKTQMDNFGRGKTDAYGAAQNDAITRGGEEMTRQYNLGMQSRQQSVSESNYMRELASKEAAAATGIGSSANADLRGLYGTEATQQGAIDTSGKNAFDLQNQDRSNALSEMERKRAAVLNELSALRSGSQVQMPNFSSGQSGANVSAAPYAQSAYNTYQGQLGQYNSEVASNNQTMGSLASLAGTAMSAFGMF